MRNRVFVSYSHADERWLKRLQVHLKPLERAGIIDRWDDSRIEAGADWKAEIGEALASARVAVLLVSADFLSSDFIDSDELPALLRKAEEDGLTLLSVILKPCRFKQTGSLSRLQSINPPERALIDMSEGEQEAVWVRLSQAVEAAVAAPAPPAAPRSKPAAAAYEPRIDWRALRGMAQDATTLGQVVSLIESRGAERWTDTGTAFAEALAWVGNEGTILIEAGHSSYTRATLVEGIRLNQGYLSPYFAFEGGGTRGELRDALVLVYPRAITRHDNVEALAGAAFERGKSLLLLTESVEDEPLAAMVALNRGPRRVAASRIPAFGDRRVAIAEDIAIVTGGAWFPQDRVSGLEEVELDALGQARRVRLTSEETVLMDTAGSTEAIEARIETMHRQIEECVLEYDREKLRERLSNLRVALLRVGAETSAAIPERVARTERVLRDLRRWLATGEPPPTE